MVKIGLSKVGLAAGIDHHKGTSPAMHSSSQLPSSSADDHFISPLHAICKEIGAE